jgi:hypothetical protein
MRRNVEGLKRSARQRHEDATHRAVAALRRMEASDRDINFRAVAVEARVSTAWLYGQEELRDRIIGLRRSPAAGSSHGTGGNESRRQLSTKNIIRTLRLQIKELEEKNRELRDLLEHAYGQIAKAQVRDANTPR